jgi:hypothetical protein
MMLSPITDVITTGTVSAPVLFHACPTSLASRIVESAVIANFFTRGSNIGATRRFTKIPFPACCRISASVWSAACEYGQAGSSNQHVTHFHVSPSS